MKSTIYVSISLILTFTSCTTKICQNREKRNHFEDQLISEKAENGSTMKKIKVYKYDGSLQCGQGKSIALDVMQKELKGISVFSSAHIPDGLLHIQMCGTPTGMINVYEIAETDLDKALSFGFKLWGK